TPTPAPSILYDAVGNRTSFDSGSQTYSTNDLNQYTVRNFNSAAYDTNGNMTTGLDSSAYTFDANNRVLTATKGGTSMIFTYDGLGRQVTRQVGKGAPSFNIYDGWNLMNECDSSG